MHIVKAPIHHHLMYCLPYIPCPPQASLSGWSIWAVTPLDEHLLQGARCARSVHAEEEREAAVLLAECRWAEEWNLNSNCNWDLNCNFNLQPSNHPCQ